MRPKVRIRRYQHLKFPRKKTYNSSQYLLAINFIIKIKIIKKHCGKLILHHIYVYVNYGFILSSTYVLFFQ